MGLLGICLLWECRTRDMGHGTGHRTWEIGHETWDTGHGTGHRTWEIGHGKTKGGVCKNSEGKRKCFSIGYKVSGKQRVEFAKIRRM